MNAPEQKLHEIAGKAIKLDELPADKLEHLKSLCTYKVSAGEAFAEACKALGEKSGIHPAVLATYITAVVKDTLKDKREKAEQLSLLFEELQA